MKNIAVVNRTNLKNFGSVLQVYALCEAVKKIGYNSEVVWQSGNMSKHLDLRPNKVLQTCLKLFLNPSLLKSTVQMILRVKKTVIEPEKVRLFDSFVKKTLSSRFTLLMTLKRLRYLINTINSFAEVIRFGLRQPCIQTL